MDRTQVINFGAGPSALPDSVLHEATEGLLNFQGTGIGITEISHRSKEFGAVVTRLEQLIRTQLDVPPTHHILFMQGGGTQQFSSIVLNMLARHRLLHPNVSDEDRVMDYVITGSWSKKAADEARRLGGARVNIVVDAREHSADGTSFTGIPPHEAFKFSADPALIYYCENETVNGVQFAEEDRTPTSFPFHLLARDVPGGGAIPPLVADYSSSFMSRAIPRLADHAVIFAGAQKNIGPSGLTILIVREDCLVDVDAAAKMGAAPVPIILAFKTYADSGNIYNTPSTFAMYVAMLVLQRIESLGGLKAVEEANRRKQEKVYRILKVAEEKDLLRLNVKEGSRSWMNVVFKGKDADLESRFLSIGELQGFKAMKGHRSVGGMRVSLYNAITEEQVDRLVVFIQKFIAETAVE
ncbi:phosphoserine aminotransferase [Fomitiporia mediterranea MF3/22]|uniref:phosphoserine aminotransferase n=1 Tax=Fomitiporia mediterranea (strain MF3/22) TaxID=694068 RepID=UPI000440898C|nr:phosphoserine aminotransferase [Fomitiporia mediterranea MF3/22]EJD05850.1 phosphoserine aminotransferase [Fomitiporia mediterranea MF3/22]